MSVDHTEMESHEKNGTLYTLPTNIYYIYFIQKKTFFIYCNCINKKYSYTIKFTI